MNLKRLSILQAVLMAMWVGCGDGSPPSDVLQDMALETFEDVANGDNPNPSDPGRDHDLDDGTSGPDVNGSDAVDVVDVARDVDVGSDADVEATDADAVVDADDADAVSDARDADTISDTVDADVVTDVTNPAGPVPASNGFAASAGTSFGRGYRLRFTLAPARFEVSAAGSGHVLRPGMHAGN